MTGSCVPRGETLWVRPRLVSVRSSISLSIYLPIYLPPATPSERREGFEKNIVRKEAMGVASPYTRAHALRKSGLRRYAMSIGSRSRFCILR